MAHGVATDNVTLFVNAATCTEDYQPIQPPIVFDLPPAKQLREVIAHAAGRQRQGPA